MNLFQRGNFLLHAGTSSNWKIDCDALTDDDIETCAFLIAEDMLSLGGFGRVLGIPRGGLRLARALEKYADPEDHYLLVVDDVLTTGKSMNEILRKEKGVGYVIFARGPLPPGVHALFSWTRRRG